MISMNGPVCVNLASKPGTLIIVTFLRGSLATRKDVDFFLDFPGSGKSWKISLVLESPGN